MSLFQCDECGCVDNSACGGTYHTKNTDLWAEEDRGKELCVVCSPKKFVDGSENKGAGIWHNHFDRAFLEKGKWKTNREGNLEHIKTGETDFRKYAIDS